jgi:hypothetical protein
MSTLFVRTLREDPADADVRSHRLLVRAGYIRRGRAAVRRRAVEVRERAGGAREDVELTRLVPKVAG